MNARGKHVLQVFNKTLLYLFWASKALYHSENENCETSKKVKFQPLQIVVKCEISGTELDEPVVF